MKKILIIVVLIGTVLGSILWFNVFQKKPTVTINKIPYVVETILAKSLNRDVTISKPALLKAGSQVSVLSQSAGRIGAIYVRPGESVVAGEVLAEIDDTYGMTGNTSRDARIGVETARIAKQSTKISLDQAVKNAETAYEKAKKDYDLVKLTTEIDPKTGKSKAQIDYENFVATQEKTLQGFEETYTYQRDILKVFITNVSEKVDTLLGVSPDKDDGNDNFEYLLAATDSAKKSDAEDSLRKLLAYKSWQPDMSKPLLERIAELRTLYSLTNTVLTDAQVVLVKSVTDASHFTETTRGTYRTSFDAYQAQYGTMIATVTSFENTVRTYLATYLADRDSRQKTLSSTEATVKDALALAQSALETAKQSRDASLSSIDNTIRSAEVRLANANAGVNKLSITAPVDGVVGKIYISRGEEVAVNRAILDIASTNAECEITVDSTLLSQIVVGTKVEVSYRGKKLAGIIASASPIADKGLNYSVKVAVTDSVDVYGDFATVIIPMASLYPTLPLPAVNILAPGQGQVYIFKNEGNEGNEKTPKIPMTKSQINQNDQISNPSEKLKTTIYSVETKDVTLWALWNDRVEITSLLNPDDEIILTDMKNFNVLDYELQRK